MIINEDYLEIINSTSSLAEIKHGPMRTTVPKDIYGEIYKIYLENNNKAERPATNTPMQFSSKEGGLLNITDKINPKIIKYLLDSAQKYLSLCNIAINKKIDLNSVFLIKKGEKDYIKNTHSNGRLVGFLFLETTKELKEESVNGRLEVIYGSNSQDFLNIVGGSLLLTPEEGKMYLFPSWTNFIFYPTYKENKYTSVVQIIFG